MEKVSVIIPAYNAENFISRCLNSVTAQTYKNLEIIVINDGSRDTTLQILNSYKEKDGRITVIDQQNKGVSAARNIGLKAATGEFILFVDADDWIAQDMVERLISFASENASIVVCGSDNALSTENAVILPHKKRVLNTDKGISEFLIHKDLQGMLWNKLIKSSLFDGVFFDESVGYGEDAQVVWQLVKKAQNTVMISDVLYHHIIEPTSISNKAFSPVKYDAVRVWQEILTDCQNNFADYTVLARERTAFFAAYTLFCMLRANYNDTQKQKEFLQILRQNKGILFKSKNISFKTKLFAIAVLTSKGLAKLVCKKI